MRYKMSENTNLFATVSKGYKAGGVSTGNNTNATGSPAFSLPYDPEELLNIEFGIKSELADHRVRLNASVFVLRWKDLQVEAFRFLTPGDLSSNFEQTVNIPKAEGKGIEIELLAKPTDNFTVGGSLGYLETEITEQPDTSSGQPGVEITGGFIVDVLGLDIPKAPAVTANLFGEYRWPIGSNAAWVRGEVLYRDSQYSDIEALTNQQTDGQPSPNQGLIRDVQANEFPYKVPEFSVVNLRGGFEWQRASLSLYVQNLLDEEYYTGTQENFGLSGIRLRPHPRVYGASVSFKF
jgi:iron complex outermembrane receptor protein